jgi:hypothetical protein
MIGHIADGVRQKWRAAREYYTYGGLSEVLKQTFRMVGERTNDRFLSTNVYEKEWDILVVLDACRADLMREALGQRDGFGDVETLYSVGTKTNEWLSKTFDDQYAERIAETIYVSGNPNTYLVDENAFRLLDNVW